MPKKVKRYAWVTVHHNYQYGHMEIKLEPCLENSHARIILTAQTSYGKGETSSYGWRYGLEPGVSCVESRDILQASKIFQKVDRARSKSAALRSEPHTLASWSREILLLLGVTDVHYDKTVSPRFYREITDMPKVDCYSDPEGYFSLIKEMESLIL